MKKETAAETWAKALLGARAPQTASPPTAPPVEAPRELSEEAPLFDRAQAQIFIRWYSGLLDIFAAAGRTVGAAEPDPATAGGNSKLLEIMMSVHRMLLEHPVAAKSGFRALVAEGRAYAETPEGRELRRRLEGSEEVSNYSTLWRTLTLGTLEDGEPASLPSTYLEELLAAGASPEFLRTLGALNGRK